MNIDGRRGSRPFHCFTWEIFQRNMVDREHQQQALCRSIPGTFWKEHKKGQHEHVDQTKNKNLKRHILN